MAQKLMKIVADCTTGAIYELELTADEIAEREAMAVEAQARQAELEAQEAAKASAIDKLKKLGLSDSEIAALV